MIRINLNILRHRTIHLNYTLFKINNTKLFSSFDKIDNNIDNNCTNHEDKNDIREKLIKMSLVNVNKYGWTENSIKIAANELGYSNSLSAILNKGAVDLIYYTMDNWNEKLKQEVNAIKAETHLSTDEKLKKALKLRLSYEIPLINTWPAAIRLGMNFTNLPSTLERLIETVNIIASIEEGTSVTSDEFEYKSVGISKKYLIMKIFIITELHMMTDRSFNFNNTWDFLEKFYQFNFGICSSLAKFGMINSSVLSLIKYSLISLAPYDFSQVDEIMRKKFDLEQKEANKL